MNRSPITVRFTAPFALFSAPEYSTDKVSYDVITPSAARGALESIYWHRGVNYVIDYITINNPIKSINVTRNEVKNKIPASNVKTAIKNGTPLEPLNVDAMHTQSKGRFLVNVDYIIEAHIEPREKEMNPSDSLDKFYAICNRRIAKGQCFRQPYMGVKECPAGFSPAVTPPRGGVHLNRDFGLMHYGNDYEQENPVGILYHAVARNGVIDVLHAQKYTLFGER